jgi:hypothetical protein
MQPAQKPISFHLPDSVPTTKTYFIMLLWHGSYWIYCLSVDNADLNFVIITTDGFCIPFTLITALIYIIACTVVYEVNIM